VLTSVGMAHRSNVCLSVRAGRMAVGGRSRLLHHSFRCHPRSQHSHHATGRLQSIIFSPYATKSYYTDYWNTL